MVGYSVVFYLQQESIRKELVYTLDNAKIPEKDFIVFKTHILLPYQLDRDFERADGNFEHKGKYYEMVKKRLKDDTLYVYCINNVKKENLKADLAKHVAEYVGDSKSSENKNRSEKIVKNLIKEYVSHSTNLFYSTQLFIALSKGNTKYLFPFSSTDLRIPSPPPKIS